MGTCVKETLTEDPPVLQFLKSYMYSKHGTNNSNYSYVIKNLNVSKTLTDCQHKTNCLTASSSACKLKRSAGMELLPD